VCTQVSYSEKISEIENFKVYLRQIGSGENTSKTLSRSDAAEAMRLMLIGKASQAQIGAFLIAHRIRRPKSQELAGMLDAYLNLGPIVKSKQGKTAPICFGMPFDGRNKTAPIYPLTSLVLLSESQPIFLQGGQAMPTKYGVTTVELFANLGLNLKGLSLKHLEDGFDNHGFGFMYQPDHFPLAESLISYRDQIGKRSPISTLELLWTIHQGEHLLINGFFHPPTEQLISEALEMHGERNLICIKGLEGSTDLPINRKCIARKSHNNEFKEIILNPLENDCAGSNQKWTNIHSWREAAFDALNFKGPLKQSLRWNSGAYLWLSGRAKDLYDGISKADNAIKTGKARNTLEKLILWRSTY